MILWSFTQIYKIVFFSLIISQKIYSTGVQSYITYM